MADSFYLTTTLPYVNAQPHIGFALELIAADVIARYQDYMGRQVFFNSGTDEHGQKIYEKALENHQDPQEYVNYYAEKFRNLQTILNLYPNLHFIRTTDSHHIVAAQEFWRRCAENINPETGESDIYKATYSVLYCVGCELEKQASDLSDGRCPLHPNKELQTIEEENYFFRFSRYQKQLLTLYSQEDPFVQPESKLKEIASFVSGGLQDFSISRLKEKMPWGVEVPGDKEHVMYVWFDALVNYISTLGWPKDVSTFDQFWPGIQLCGKDNLRQQSAMWQAMLLSAGITTSKKILVNGFISVNGQKMSKSLGNVISPEEMIDRYSIDGTRYLLMNLGPFGNDMDVTWEKFDRTYTADLSNGLGNLASRVAKMCEKASISGVVPPSHFAENFQSHFSNYHLQAGLSFVQELIGSADQFLSESKPWEKSGEEQTTLLKEAVKRVVTISYHLLPYMPATAQTLIAHFSSQTIHALSPLFPRLQ